MSRLLLTPKWIGLTLLALVLIGVFAWLGGWQWSRSKVEPRADPAHPVADDPRILVSLYHPGQPVPEDLVGAPVMVKGSFDAENQLLVPGRDSDGTAGSWVLTPLVLSAGSAIPVVRGWVPDQPAATAIEVPAGLVTVVGWLAEPEHDALRPVVDLRDDQIGIVSTAELLSRWPYDLYEGFVVLGEQRPDTRPALTPVVPDAMQPPESGVRWQNWGYAWQWWIFACFVVFLWARMLREDWKDLAEAQEQARPMEEVR